jgi:hypothetical protein
MLDVTTTNGNKNSQEYLYDLLTKIKQRPGMYLGKVSITRLKMLLMGYSMSRGELGLQLTQQEKQFSQVEDEKLAFDLFFQLWEQFKNQVTSIDHVVKI